MSSNGALPIHEGVAADFIAHPMNGLRLTLHPDRLAARIANLAEWRSHVLHRLREEIHLTADPEFLALEPEVSQYPAAPAPQLDFRRVAVDG